jgi:enamine deaminase RidA (YjgF/YER057c/UK114 family)
MRVTPMPGIAAVSAERIAAAAVPDLPAASWTNGWRIGNEVVLSGMTAHPATRDAAAAGQPLDAYAQTLQVLGKLETLVVAAGGHRHNIVKTVVYLTNIADKDAVGRARREFFGSAFPCSTLVAVKALVFPELCVEIDAWARLDVDLRGAAAQG